MISRRGVDRDIEGLVEERVGSRAVRRLRDTPLSSGASSIPTGFPSLDKALGVGGIPRGRVVEIFGPPSSGKLTLALSLLSQAQSSGEMVAYVDLSGDLDPVVGARLGVKMGSLLIVEPHSLREGFEIALTLISSETLGLLVFDLAAGASESKSTVLDPRLMSTALRRLVCIIARSKSSVIFVNRLIATGSNEHKESPGGKALKHYASIRLRMERGVWPRRGSDIIGLRGDVRVVKNKLAAPFRVAEFDLLYDEGISREGELLDLGTDLGVITKSGAYYSYGDIRLGH